MQSDTIKKSSNAPSWGGGISRRDMISEIVAAGLALGLDRCEGSIVRSVIGARQSGLAISAEDEEEMYKELFLGLVARNLTEISDPNVIEIGPRAFSGYGGYAPYISIKKVDFPNATTIGQRAFEGCWGITYLNVPKLSGMIPDYAFASLESYEGEIYLPLATSLGNRVFFNCFKVRKIYLPNVVSIANDSYLFQAIGSRRSDSDTDEYGNVFKTLVVLTSKNMSDLMTMSAFPYLAPTTTKFQCSDGYIIYDTSTSSWKAISS